ncbi:MAG TPA: aminoglycoside 6-adenylyltransferase [Longimicrobium sp.]|nr:aminoglycoside 6-adenylyltransferase [Longimicrobium sp.]
MTRPTPAPEADPVLARLLAWAWTQENVRAVVLTSTRAVPGGRVDELSDWDVVLYLDDPAPFAASADWLAEAYGPVLVWWGDEHEWRGFRHSMRLVIYRDGTKVDFTLAPADELAEMVASGVLPGALDVGYRVLLDRDARTVALPPPTFTAHVPPRPTAAEYRALVDEFWFESTYVAKNLRRGELFPARHSLDCVMRDHLRRMLEWRVETERGWSHPPGALGRRMREVVDERSWGEVEATFAGASTEEGWKALAAMLRLFRRIAREVGDALGFTYPRELDDTMTAHLERVRGGRLDDENHGQGG